MSIPEYDRELLKRITAIEWHLKILTYLASLYFFVAFVRAATPAWGGWAPEAVGATLVVVLLIAIATFRR